MRRVIPAFVLTFAVITAGARGDDFNPFAPTPAPNATNGPGSVPGRQNSPFGNAGQGAMGFESINIGTATSILKFPGTGARSASATFTVKDKWQIFWAVPGRVNLTVLNPDGSIVAGMQASGHGSVFVGKGGTYYLQADNPLVAQIPSYFIVAELNGNAPTPDVGGDSSSPNASSYRNYTPPATILPPDGSPGAVAQNNVATPVTPIPGQPPAAAQPTATPAPSVTLTDDQARAVVLIKGDKAEGTGFLVKTPDGPVVVTNIHVIANNPNLKITTSTGALIKTLTMKAASDRDLALVAIQDAGYSYLEMSPDISKNVQPGDEVITPGNSQGGEVMLNTGGHVFGIGPERIEFDNPIYHGNSGGPVFHPKSGKVLGVVTEAMKVDTSNELDKASFASRNSAISGAMRYFGLRLDTVASWISVDPRQFQIETTFLDEFHEQSRRLDSLMNQHTAGSDGSNPNESRLYATDEKIMKAIRSYSDHTANGDVGEISDAKRGLIFDLQSIADKNMMQIQNANNFYSFDKERAREELEYRKALKDEIERYSDNIGRAPRTYGGSNNGSN